MSYEYYCSYGCPSFHSLAVGFTSAFAELTQTKEEDVLVLLKETTIARGFARRRGADIDDESLKEVLQAILDGCRRGSLKGGKIRKDRFKCFLDAFKLFEDLMMKKYEIQIQASPKDFIDSIPEFFEGDESIKIQDAL